MSVNPKREAALKLLKSTGMWPSNYAPPIFRMLWSLGLDLRPPHFANFFVNTILMGTFFAATWGFFMWVLIWSHRTMSPTKALLVAACAGLFFGLVMSGYYAYGKRKYKLPSWGEF